MANQKVPQLPVLSAVTGEDLFYVVDVSDTTDDPTGSSKQITRDDILKNITGLTINGNLTVTGNTQSIFSGNTSSDIVRITQTGSGNAFVVEDSASPDSTAFVINNVGDTGIGTTPNSSYKLIVSGASTAIRGESTNQTGVDGVGYVGVKGTSLYTGETAYGVQGTTNGLGAGVSGWNLYGNGNGVLGVANSGTAVRGIGGIYGGRFSASSDGSPIGVYGYVTDNEGGGTDYIAGKFEAAGGTNRYSLQLLDGTQGVNKVLISTTSDGKANWSSNLTGLTSVSATTYYNLPVDPNTYVTGFTYNNSNVLTLSQNNGESAKTVLINRMTGLTLDYLTVAAGIYGNPTKLTVSGSTSDDLVRITQLGSGNAFVVEDSTNPDTTSFIIDSAGRVGVGQQNPNMRLNVYDTSTLWAIYGQGGTASGGAVKGVSNYIGVSGEGVTGVSGAGIGGTGVVGFSYNTIGVYGNGPSYGGDFISASVGVRGSAYEDVGAIGVYGTVTDIEAGNGDYIGGKFESVPVFGGNKYSIQLIDGTEGVNKVLVSKTSDGKSNWSSVLTGLTSVSATSISATTYYGLPTDIRVTGGTYSSGTATFTNNTGGTFSVTGFTNGGSTFTGGTVSGATNFTGGLTANTISATTYYNLPIDPNYYVTGVTFVDNILTVKQSGQSDITTLIETVTGWTVNGGLSATTFSGVSIDTIDYIRFNTGATITPTVEGEVFFDNVEHALSYNTSINQGVKVNLGQQNYLRVFNISGVEIPRGKVLEILSSHSGLPSVTLAVNEHTGFNLVGVSAENIPDGSEGIVITNGIISDIQLTGMTVGSLVYASDTTPGDYVSKTLFEGFPLTARTNSVGYVIQTGETTGKLFVNIVNENSALSLTDLERNVLEGNVLSTGVFEYTGATTASTTTFNVAPLKGWIVKNTYTYALTPDVQSINYSGGTNISVTNIASADSTYILINSGLTITQQVTFPTPQQRRENIFLGKINHPNRTSILNINQTVDYDVSPMSSLRDLWSPIKLINQGIIPSPNGANLSFNTSAGTLWGNGINWNNNQLSPNNVNISAKVPASFFYRTQTGGTSSSVTVIDPTKYDVGGAITTITPAGSNDATNQRIYMYPTGVINVLYGQTRYTTLAEAIANIQSETFIPYPNAESTGILIGVLSVRNDIVADGEPLTNTDYAKFTLVSKFGESFGGTGGLSTTNLQQAYNNSTTPEILTNSTLGPLSLKNGNGADNVSNLFEGINSGGTTTMFVRADGSISATTVSATTINTGGFSANGNGLTATTISATTYQNLPNSVTGWTVNGNLTVTGNTSLQGVTATTVSATTYQNLPTDIRVTGGTYSSGTATFTNNTGGTFDVSGYYTGSTVYLYEIHVSTIDGNDTTGDGSLLYPVATITKGLTLISGNRRTLIIHPGTYTESPSITSQYTVLTTFEPLGGNTSIVGTVSTSVGSTIAGLTIQNLTITAGSGVGVPNIINSNITGTLTKSGNATFTDIHNCDIGTVCNITGTGLVTINDGNPNFVTVNNAGANVIIKGAMSCVSPSVTSGTLSITDSIVIAAVTNAVTSSAGSVVTLANSQLLTSTLDNVAPVSLSGFYSIFNCVFDKPSSTLVASSGTGGSTNSIVYSQYINADKFITQGGASSQYVMGDGSLSNGFTGGTVSGATNFTNGLTATTISATTYQNLPVDPNYYTTAFTYSNNVFTIKQTGQSDLTATINSVTGWTVNGNLTVTGNTSLQGVTATTVSGTTVLATTVSATTYQNLPTDIRVTGGTYYDGSITFTNNTGGTFSVTIPSNFSAGPISGSTGWSSAGSGQMNLPGIKVALFDNPNNYEPVNVYSVSSGTTGSGGIPSLTDNDTNYVVVEYNGGSPIYNVYDNDGVVNDSSVVLVYIVYRLDSFVHVMDFGDFGAGLPNKLNDRLMMTDRFGRESGLSLGLSGSTGVVTATEGVAWNASYRQSLVAVNSQDEIFFKNYHSGGTWTYTTTGDTLNNTYYDNGTNIVELTAGKYLVNWYFRGQEVNDHLYEVYGNDEYDSVSEAELSVEPLLPELITSHAFLLGRIIVLKSATTGVTQSAFVKVFQSTQVDNHNDLIGLQGGGPGEYYHLTSSHYNNLPYKNSGNTFTELQTFSSGLTATTISATTYYGSGTNLTGVVKGSGTTNYLPRWTGTTDLGNSVIRDDGTNVGVNIAPTTGAKFKVLGTTANTYSVHAQGGTSTSIWGENTATGGYGVYGSNSLGGYGVYGSANYGGYGLYGSSSAYAAGALVGVKGTANGMSSGYGPGTGVYGQAYGDYGGIGVFGSAVESETGAGVYLGGKFVSTLPSAGGTNYSVQLQDGTEGLNKVLVSVTADGKANWSSNLTGLTSVSATTISGGTMVITTSPTNNDNNTQILSRNSSTGVVEYIDGTKPVGTFNYGLANAIMTGNFLT